MAGGGGGDGNTASDVADAKPDDAQVNLMPPGSHLRSADNKWVILLCDESIIRKKEQRWTEGEEEWWGAR